MSARFHVYVLELQLRGLGNTCPPAAPVRMSRRLLRKILQFVCLLCPGTIKTQGRANWHRPVYMPRLQLRRDEAESVWGTNVSPRQPATEGQ